MPDENPNQDPSTGQPGAGNSPTADDLLKELTELKSSLAEERSARTQLQEFTQQVVGALSQPRQPEARQEPEADDIPDDDDFDNDRVGSTARVAATMLKRGLSEYDQGLRRELAELRSATASTEFESVRQEDPKNFARLEKMLRSHFQKHPDALRPGAVRQAFYQLRGQYSPQLQEMDRKEAERRAAEPVADPAPASGPSSKKEVFDELNSEELEVIRGLRGDPKTYFTMRHGRQPKFEKGYLAGLGFREEESNA